MEQQNVTLKWVIGILVAIIVIGGGVWYFTTINSKVADVAVQPNTVPVTDKIVPEPTTATTPIESPAVTTADWKNYTNTKYGFSIKYPSSVIQTDISDSDFRFSLTSESDSNILDITINPTNNRMLDDQVADMTKNSQLSSATKTTFGGAKAYEAIYTGLLSYYGIIAQNNSYTYQLVLITNNSNNLASLKGAMTDTQKVMLSTFQFIN